MRNVIVAILCVTSSATCAADQRSSEASLQMSEPGLQLYIEPIRPLTADQTHVRVWLENVTGVGCLPKYIDPTFVSQDWGRRPYVVLTFEIRNDSGELIQPEKRGHAQYVPIKAHELVRLDCGHSYGVTVELEPGRGEWPHSLAPGQYRIAVAADINVQEYLKEHPEVTDDLRELEGGTLRDEWLPQVELRSNEIEVLIE